jgi:phosphate transport system substrate-binding protein
MSMKALGLRRCKSPWKGHWASILFLGGVVALLSSCTQTLTPTAEAVEFTLCSDTSTAPLIEELAAAYQIAMPNVSINLERAANAERVLEGLQAGQCGLASASWLPDSEEAEGRLWKRAFARDSIVLITHSTNPVGGLSLPQLRGIFQGQVLLWSELGGLDVGVNPVSREGGAGTRAGFESLVMGKRDVALTAIVMPSSEAVAQYVATTPGAIGYVASAWLVPSVNLLAVEGVTPSPDSVEDGRYLLVGPLYLAAHNEPVGGLAEFVHWVQEREGQDIIKRAYAPAP